MKRKKTKLKNIRINEVSLVDKGANPGAEVLLFKRNNEMEENEIKEVDKEEVQTTDESTTNVDDTTSENQDSNVADESKNDEEQATDENKDVSEENNPEDVEKAMSEFSAAIVASESLEDLWELHQALKLALKSVLESGDDVMSGLDRILSEYTNAIKAKITDSMSLVVTQKNNLMEMAVELDKSVLEYLKSAPKDISDELLSKENVAEEINKAYESDSVITAEGVTIIKSVVGDSAFDMIKKVQEEKKELQEKYDAEVAKRTSEEFISKTSEILKDYPLDDSVKTSICEELSKMDDNAKSSFEKLFSAGKEALTGLTEQLSVDVSKVANKQVKTEQDKALDYINKQKEKGKKI